MKRTITLLFLLPFLGVGQNLIPNGGFEDTLACPHNLGYLENADFWINPTWGTPDLMHTCDIWPGIAPMGYQLPHGGSAFGGFFTGGPTSQTREYIETPIISPLISGQCYQLTFFANLGNKRFSTDAIHAYFSDTLIDNVQTVHVLSYNYQISNPPGNFLDTINWTLVQGEYLANGGENFLLIGNFDSSQYCNWVISDSSVVNTASYVYIDDISLFPSPCTGISELSPLIPNLYPNPTSSYVHISLNYEYISEIRIFNNLSQLILVQSFTKSIKLNLENFQNGIYYYQIKNKNSLSKIEKLIKLE